MSAGAEIDRVVAALERWIRRHQAASWDPYDGLTSPFLRPLVRSRFAARAAMQLVKRSPLNLRPLLAIRPRVLTKSLSDLASAYAVRARQDEPGAAAAARAYRDALGERRLHGVQGSAWGMDLPYVSRFAAADERTPNLFQTVNAVDAFLDLFDLDGRQDDLDVAAGFLEFLEKALGRLEDGAGHVAWRYYPGQAACVYNVNALAGATLLRLGRVTGRADLVTLGCKTLEFVRREQNPDGSWWYARGAQGRWVDGFHTGYVLEALCTAVQMDPDGPWRATLEAGTAFYIANLFAPGHLPRYTPASTYPIEVQNCAQAVQTLARLSAFQPGLLDESEAVARVMIEQLFRWEDEGAEALGAFVLARGRLVTNRLRSVRWGQAPALLALVRLQACRRAAGRSN